MLEGREAVELAAVAAGVGEDEVVAEVERVAGPRDEVVDDGLAAYGVRAVEAAVPVDLTQEVSHGAERRPVGAEQELVQVRFAKEGLVPRKVAHEPDPGCLGDVADQLSEQAEAVDRLAVKLDAVSLPDVGVEEVELLGTDGLELPEGHDLDRPRHVAQEPAPSRLVPSEAGKGALELLVRRGHAG